MFARLMYRWYSCSQVNVPFLMRTLLQKSQTNQGVLSGLSDDLELGAEKIRRVAENVLWGRSNFEEIYVATAEWEDMNSNLKLPRKLTPQEAATRQQIDTLRALIISSLREKKTN